MRTNLKMLSGIVLLASGIANAGAQELPKGENVVMGKAQIVYVQVAPGLFMDNRIRSAAAPAKQLQADVRADKPVENGSQPIMVATKKGGAVAHGDAIEPAGCTVRF